MPHCVTLPTLPHAGIISPMNQVKIKVRPQEIVRFPGLCVHCGQPAPAAMTIRKRIGRVTRLIDVPLCRNCAQEVRRLSADEERLQKIGRLASAALFLLTLGAAVWLTPAGMSFLLRLLVGLSAAAGVTAVSLHFFHRAQANAARPEKKAIRQSAQIATFSWRAATFNFADETFTERFQEINEPLLMEN